MLDNVELVTSANGAMTNPRVLCLGEILFDLLAYRLGLLLEQVQSWTPYAGGAPANVACALVKLGTSSGFIGSVGVDEPGNSLVQLLQDVGVDVTGVQRHPTAPTRQVYVVRSESGDRTVAGFVEIPTTDFADAYLQANDIPVSLFADADFLVLGTLELAYPETRAAIEKAIGLAEQYDVKIMVDVNWRPVFWSNHESAKQRIKALLKKVDFLKISDEEADFLFGTQDADAIKYKLDAVDGVAVTAGDRDVSYCLGGNEGKVSAFSVDVRDTTGAGDGFTAGFIHQLCLRGIQCLKDSQTASDVITYACAVGALTAMKPGAIASQPTAGEVEDFLANYVSPS